VAESAAQVTEPTRSAVSGRSSGQVADVQGVLAEAGVVGGVGEQIAVRADGHRSDCHIGLADCKFIYVQQRLLRAGRRGGGAAAVDGVLAAFEGAGPVEPAVVGVGDGFVGLLDMREHLGVELGLQLLCWLHQGRGVGVFGFEIFEEFGRGLIAHPGVVVGQRVAVDVGGRGDAAGGGWLNSGNGSAVCGNGGG